MSSLKQAEPVGESASSHAAMLLPAGTPKATDAMPPHAAVPKVDANGADAAAMANPKKRVFTFQKRWLHSLPIMEKTLSDASMEAALARAESGDGSHEGGVPTRDVIACMLCEDPGASREVFVKTWSRTNCRRGRIENHLMSKHPEFMLLLKQKRDAEGDLAVQIFLQNMREGRCNYRSEISTGLYNHLQHPVGTAGGALVMESFAQSTKRPYPTEELIAAAGSVAAVAPGKGPVFQQLLGARDAAEALDDEAKRKKAKLSTSSNGNGSDRSPPLEGVPAAPATPTASQVSSAFAFNASPTQQGRATLVDKVIVVTGGDNPIIAQAATQLWLKGANVLITFANADVMRSFEAERMARLPESEDSDSVSHGSFVPLWCPFQTRAQAQEWSAAIATRFSDVHALINYTSDENIASASTVVNDAGAPGAQEQEQEAFVSNTQRLLELCQAFVAACLRKTGTGVVINVATPAAGTQSSMTCAAIEALTKSLATELATTQIAVNCVLCQPSPKPIGSASDTDSESFELAHLLLFLLAPESATISGSVLRLRATPTVLSVPEPSATAESLATADSVV